MRVSSSRFEWLNNAQSILQNQIEQFGDHFFKDGSVVTPGGITYDDSIIL